MRGSSRNGSMDNLSSGPGSPAHGSMFGGSQHSNVYVKNLSEDVDEMTLKGVFDKFGAVESCCVIRDVSTNSSRGFGFVKFMQVHQAEVAIKEMNGKVIRGKALEVKFANSDSSASTAASGVGTISDNIYVKGLPPLWTEVELRAFFKIFGNIIECRLLHASGTTTAGALIRFGSMEQAASAVVTANGRVPAGGQVSFFSFTYIWAM
jgi:RNA recognition motif-containing protein